jgi:two-component SAPR family response regulator
VESGGQPVTDPEWQTRREVRELFFLFLSHPEGLSKEAVGEILWPGSSARQLRVRFKNAVYRLRRALGQDVILFDENLYRFNKGLDYEYDVEMFVEKLSQADDAVNPADRVVAYQAAIELYKGPYLPEVEGTWVWPERYRLEQVYLKTILALAEYHLETAEYEATLEYCQRALGEDPCLEQAHRLAMRTYAAMGNRVAVARQFEHCRYALKKEIDAQPSAQTESLYANLMH